MKMLFLTVFSFMVVATAHAEIEIKDSWARATVPNARTGAIYMVFHNTGKDDALVGANTELAMRTEVHQTSMDADGMMSMDHMDEVALPKGVEVAFAPGGYHVMLMGLKQQLQPGYEIPLTLTFKSGLERAIRVPIKPIAYRPEKP